MANGKHIPGRKEERKPVIVGLETVAASYSKENKAADGREDGRPITYIAS